MAGRAAESSVEVEESHSESASPSLPANIIISESKPVTPVLERKEDIPVVVPAVTLTRKQLYDEVWKISAAGLAKKYDIPYAQLLKQLKDASIPIPPSGYWTKLNFGKPVEKAELSEPYDKVIVLQRKLTVTKGRKPRVSTTEASASPKSATIAQAVLENVQQKLPQQASESPQKAESLKQPSEPDTIDRYGQTYNIYDRKTLYHEVWTSPVTEVAKKYKVSDVAIHKVCKSLNIPTPPPGYWAKLRAGQQVEKTPLPQGDDKSQKTGIQTGYTASASESSQGALDFLDEETQKIVLAIASQVLIPDENERMHSAIIAHRKAIVEWKKRESKNDGNRWQARNAPQPPYLVGSIADESIPRACHIIDALIKAMEPLGCKLTDSLSFIVSGETVSISFSESQDKLDHVPTKDENRQLLEYEEQRKKYSYASKPQIRKYDYKFNGRLSLTVNGEKTFRDCKSYRLEERLGDVLIELYIAAENLKQQRLAREEAERKRREEEKRKEERRERYNKEIDRTVALANEAKDYDIACQIRAYIAAYKSAHSDEDIDGWVTWANAKADWYDPTISRKDELLGERNHSADDESKKPKHAGYYW